MSKKDDEDKLLRDKGFDPDALSDDERKDALKLIAEENGTPPAPADPVPPSNGKTVYFRSRLAGLSVQVGPPLSHEVAPQTVRFEPFLEMFQGDAVKVGYLATNNPVAIRKCRDDYNVDEIDEAAYKKATNLKDKNIKRVSV